jgi:hypothetical protein
VQAFLNSAYIRTKEWLPMTDGAGLELELRITFVDKQQIKDQFFLGLWAYFSGPDGRMDENACMAMVETLGMAVCITEASRLGCAGRKMQLHVFSNGAPDLFV